MVPILTQNSKDDISLVGRVNKAIINSCGTQNSQCLTHSFTC